MSDTDPNSPSKPSQPPGTPMAPDLATGSRQEGPSAPTRAEAHRTPLGILTLTALGIVYGDIGTSPLYSMKECFHGPHAVPVTAPNILGVLSLVFWSLILVVTVKYIFWVLRADNRGEGGIMALMALVLNRPSARKNPKKTYALMVLGVFGAALLYGDGMITPAISVLSAVEGLEVVAQKTFSDYVLPIAIIILLGLFFIQRHGTAGIGKIFGPITLLWFASIGIFGLWRVLENPGVLAAMWPGHGVSFFIENGWRGFLVLGSVFLVVTGGESLYADMGHFGRRPIQIAWFSVVLPGLLLNYFGQGALLLNDATSAVNPFYFLPPRWALFPMVILATLATCIASQALISGAFSLTRQAVQLGYSPRLDIVHTSAREIGQIYVPFVNWVLLISVIILVMEFGSSSRLAAAYGIAVSATMIITTVLATIVSREIWGWSRWLAYSVAAFFLSIEIAFFSANALKFLDGGWVPMLVALVVFTLMTTWKRGRAILSQRLRAASLPLDSFLESFRGRPPLRVPGTAVFMTGNPEGTPTALLHNLKHNKVLHERVVLLTIVTSEDPHVASEGRVSVEALEHGIFRVIARFGFMEDPNVLEILGRAEAQGLKFKMMETTFFLGRETLIPSRRPGMALWRESLFAWMSQNAKSATTFFRIPPNRVVELGAQVEL